MLSCLDCQEEILNYLFDVSEPAERSRTSRHLEECVECRRELAQAVEELSVIAEAARVHTSWIEFEVPQETHAPETSRFARAILDWAPALAFLINPRSAFYQVTQVVRSVPWFVLSVGLHATVAALLLQSQAGHVKRDSEPVLVMDVVIRDKEHALIDPSELKRTLDNLIVVERDVPLEPVKPIPISIVTPLEAASYDAPEPGDVVKEEGPPDPFEGDDESAVLSALPMGEDLLVSVGGNSPGGPRDGAMGSYHSRRSPQTRVQALRKGGGSNATEDAVLRGLAFLAKYQQPDGHWSSSPDEFDKGAKGPNDVAITGLSLLAFLGAGHTEDFGKYRDVVSRAVNYLRRVQESNGAWIFGGRMYGHGICTMAMSEAYGMAGGNSRAGHAAQLGIDFIVETQGENGGFGYTGPGDDTSVTGWQIMACKSAVTSGLDVPEHTLRGFEAFLDAQMDPETGVTGYRARGQGSEAMTSVGLVCQVFLGRDPKRAPSLLKAADRILKTGPSMNDVYYLYYATLGMFQTGGDRWKEWNSRFAMDVVGRQVRNGRFAGSWDWQGIRYAEQGGRIYVAAMNVLCLEVYYRYLPVYK